MTTATLVAGFVMMCAFAGTMILSLIDSAVRLYDTLKDR